MAEDPVSLMRDLLTARGVAPDIVREVSATIRREYGGGAAYIRAVDREERDSTIADLIGKGVSAVGIARHLKIHPSTVRRRRSGWL